MNVILIGYRGSGKTSVGTRLAAQLWKTYADVDREACRRFGNDSIAEIWRTHGEPEWRRVEIEVTRELIGRPDHVIGLGGGTLMQPAAREAVRAAPDAVRIYLKCEPQELHRRIAADGQSAATRPSLTRHGGGLQEIEAMLAEREPVYLAVADRVVDVTHLDVDGAVRQVISKL